MKKSFVLPLLLLMAQVVFAQIKVDVGTYTSEELVTDVLINSPCATVENVSATTGTRAGFNGIGFFERAGSDFPFEQGIILSTGNASSARGPNPVEGDPYLGEGASDLELWPGDADLERSVGLNLDETYNATVLEFDFIPLSNTISFNFLMASEEYISGFPCQYSDSFAFLLRPADGSAPYQNLAVIPNTNIPISVVNIHNAVNVDDISCPARNAQFFDKLNTGRNAANSAINFNGQTKVFTASSAVVPETRYHIKLVIADFFDGDFDSAVFLEAGSFNIGGNLGDDRTIASGNPGCNGAPVVLDASVGDGATYQWQKDGVAIAGATNPTLSVTENGSYGVRVELAGTCASELDPVMVEFTIPPVIAAMPVADVFCETDGDQLGTYDFAENTARALGAQDPNSYVVSYHASQEDATNNENAIALPYTNTAPTETIYLRIADLTQTCFEVASFTITVDDLPVANTPTVYELCDDDIDGFVAFDLNTKTAAILGGQDPAAFAVRYYTSLADANAALPGTAIVGPFVNTANPQEVYARVENMNNTSCFATTPLNLVVNPLPVLNNGVVLQQCDDDTDGLSFFNLTEANVLLSANYLEEDFTYFLNQNDALNNTNPIADPLAYQNPQPLAAQVFARVSTNKDCFRVAAVDLRVSATQIPAGFALNYELCDDTQIDQDNTNGVASFNFSDATATITGLFPAGQQLSISYYQTEADALAETNAIADIANHRNTTSPNTQNIYVRVDSDDQNACLGLGHHITLTVNPLPLANPITEYQLCSDTDAAVFDLSTKDAEVLGNQTAAILISYHASLAEAQTGVNPLGVNHTNTSNPQTIYVRAQFDDNGNGIGDPEECFSTDMQFDLRVNPNPVLQTAFLSNCSFTVGSVYNLQDAKPQITTEGDTVSLSFFETEADLQANTPIANPEGYALDQLQQQLIVVGAYQTGCLTRTTLDLETVVYLDINTSLDPIEECETDTDGIDNFNLVQREAALLNGIDPTTVAISYYINEADAQAGNPNTIANPSQFTNTVATAQTVYIRIKPLANSCFQVVPLALRVNSVPPIGLAEQYVLCFDANNDPLAPFTTIATGLDANNFNFEWYRGPEATAANLIANADQPSLTVTQTGTYWVRVIYPTSGCDFFEATTVIPSYVPRAINVTKTNDTFSRNNTLEVAVDGDGTYEYQLDAGPFQPANRFTDVTLGLRTITVRDIYGCGTLSTQIMVIDYPRYFSPNGDNISDRWNIVGGELLQDPLVRIFDRYGMFITQINANEPGWDGTFKGRALPAGDYWFSINFIENGVQRNFKSHFSLKR